MDTTIKKKPSITAITGIVASRIFDSEEGIENINPIISNKDRTKNDVTKSRIRSGLSNPLSKDPFEEFVKIKEEFPEYIISAESASSKFFIMFSAPDMTKAKLPFNSRSMLTNVTYKAVCIGYYSVSTVIYVPDMKKHLVIFQAIIKKLNTNQFAVYFEALFKFFDIIPETSQ